MLKFKAMFDRFFGGGADKRSRVRRAPRRGRVLPDAGELANLARLTRATTRDPVELIPATEKRRFLTTDDLDLKNCRLREDYLERRARRAERTGGDSFARILGDVRPD